jgi:hypothetical protein
MGNHKRLRIVWILTYHYFKIKEKAMSKYTLTIKQAAEIADVHYGTIWKWVKYFGIGIKVGGRWKVDRKGLDRILSGELHYPNTRSKDAS